MQTSATTKTGDLASWTAGELVREAEPFLEGAEDALEADAAPDPVSQNPICQSAQAPSCCADCGSGWTADACQSNEGCPPQTQPPACEAPTAQGCQTADGCATAAGCATENCQAPEDAQRSLTGAAHSRVLVVG